MKKVKGLVCVVVLLSFLFFFKVAVTQLPQ